MSRRQFRAAYLNDALPFLIPADKARFVFLRRRRRFPLGLNDQTQRVGVRSKLRLTPLLGNDTTYYTIGPAFSTAVDFFIFLNMIDIY